MVIVYLPVVAMVTVHLTTDCWWCQDNAEDGICELHGDLIPCTEHVTQQGTKDPLKCPVPSFVKIDVSTIPNCGHGVFATKFIKPGHIIGVYKKLLKYICKYEY